MWSGPARVGAGAVWMWGGDACIALGGGTRYGDKITPAGAMQASPPHIHTAPAPTRLNKSKKPTFALTYLRLLGRLANITLRSTTITNPIQKHLQAVGNARSILLYS